MKDAPHQHEIADLAGGCFWQIEDEFLNLPGVIKTQVGYEGGTMPQPTYAQVCSHVTGHAETVRVIFDPLVIEYEDLVQKYMQMHDPTQIDRQGPDVGENYRSAIFYHSPGQKAAAEKVVEEINDSGKYTDPVVTKIEPATKFWPAEVYHQQFLAKQRSR